MEYVEVILPLKLSWCPSYSAPVCLARGTRVRVKLAGRDYSGVVYRSGVTPSVSLDKVQEVQEVLEDIPPVTEEELLFWEFLSSYYMCSIGEVFKAAYPEGKRKVEGTRNARAAFKAASEASRPSTSVSVAGKPRALVSADRLERYVEEVRRASSQGRQSLVLTPEKLFLRFLETPLREEFGESLHVFSSDMTPVRRRKVAEALRMDSRAVVLGTRSALFLPFCRLGAVVIDEEQDTFYKQTEPAPRLHARDSALALARIHGASVLLGSSCPSLETVFNCRCGKYDLLPTAAGVDGGRRCPEIVNVTEERAKNGLVGPLSRVLIRAIAATAGPVCLLRCWEDEEQLALPSLFPGRDNICVKTLPELKKEGAGGALLLGVLQADAFISKDDFRSDERALQIASQLSSLCPRVIIQTAVPGRFELSRGADALLCERRDFGFPPYTRLIDVIVDDLSSKRLAYMTSLLSSRLGAPSLSDGVSRSRIRIVIPRGPGLQARKDTILSSVRSFEQEVKYTSHIVIDVDPV